jgi:nitrogenase molybdenum-iron protein NifN
MAEAMGVPAVVAPDFSDTMDGAAWGEYRKLPDGGAPVGELRALCRTGAVIDLGDNAPTNPTAGAFLETKGPTRLRVPLPVGLEASDRFFAILSGFAGEGPKGAAAATGEGIRSGGILPDAVESVRGRLVDAYADAHKYLYGARVAVACNEHLAPALVRFVAELGMTPVLAASGGSENAMRRALEEFSPEGGPDGVEILDDSDYLRVDLSSSKAYRICREARIPLIRVDFPIHDRFGGPRLLNIGYRGTMRLLDEIANTVLEKRQADSPVGFSYQ